SRSSRSKSTMGMAEPKPKPPAPSSVFACVGRLPSAMVGAASQPLTARSGTSFMKLDRLLNRLVRKAKAHYLRRKHLGPDGWLFFQAFDKADLLLSSRRESPAERRRTQRWKEEYRRRYPSPPYFAMVTDYPVAVDSDDHRVPRGSTRYNSTNRAFNARLYAWLGDRPDLTVLDIGCAGSCFVRSILEDGRVAVGVEGSDASRRAQ